MPTMLTLTPVDRATLAVPFTTTARPAERSPFAFVGERLWLDFVNCEYGLRRVDALRDFETFVRWLEVAGVLDLERASGIRRRAQQQPSGAAASVVDARRVRTALRALAERGPSSDRVRMEGLAEINRVLGRSAGTRRVETRPDGTKTSFAHLWCSGVNGGSATCPTYGAYVTTTTPLAADGTTQNGPISQAYYDALGRVIASDAQGFDGSLIRSATQYDAFGRVQQASKPYFLSGGTPKWIVNAYDARKAPGP